MQYLTALTSACTSSLVHGKPAQQPEVEARTATSTSWSCRPGKQETALSTYWYYLSTGCRWALSTYQMVLYVCLLLPGFIQMVAFYIFSPRIAKNIRYGPGSRQLLDLYWPQGATRKAADQDEGQHPVVIYITGGAWLLGYKAWGAILARRLSLQGVLVVCLDYRNFPQATAVQMLDDVNAGIAWVMTHIKEHGGDTSNVTLVGQSAGAHLGALALFHQAEVAAGGKPSLFAQPRWNPKGLRAFVSLSGIYDLPSLSQHLRKRGLGRSLLDPVMTLDSRPALQELSPMAAARQWSAGAIHTLPSITLVHGLTDKSAPHESACQMYQVLKDLGVRCELQLVEGKGHTSDLLEGPMKGGRDALVELLQNVAVGQADAVEYARLNPEVMCDWAGRVCPF